MLKKKQFESSATMLLLPYIYNIFLRDKIYTRIINNNIREPIETFIFAKKIIY